MQLFRNSLYATAVVTIAYADGSNIDFSSWESLPSMQYAASDMSVTVVDGIAYVIGGCVADQQYVDDFGVYACGGAAGGVTNRGFSYDITRANEGDTTAIPSAPRERYRHMAVAIGEEVYVLGGTDDSEAPIAEIDIFNTVTGVWRTDTAMAMTTPVTDGAAFVVGDRVHVCGGYKHYDYSIYNTTQVFDITNPEGGWTNAAELNTARGDFGIVELADGTGASSFLAVGGWDASFAAPLTSTEVYNVAADAWTAGPTLAVGRADKAIAAANNFVYVIGGEGPGGLPINEIEYFDHSVALAGGTFSAANALELDRFRFAAVAFEDRLFLFGGQGFLEGGAYGSNTSFHRVLSGVEAFEPPPPTASTGSVSARCGAWAAAASAVAVLVAATH